MERSDKHQSQQHKGVKEERHKNERRGRQGVVRSCHL